MEPLALSNKKIGNDAPTDLICYFVVEGDNYKLNKRNPIFFHGEEFIEAMSFIEFHQKKEEQLKYSPLLGQKS